MKTLGVITDEESSGCQSPVFTSPHDGQDVYNRQVLDEMARGIVQDSTPRIVGPPHDAFHAVDGPEEMAAVDTVRPAGADKNVLVVVGHSNHFMGNNLPDRKDQIEIPFDQHAVDLNRPGVVQLAFGLLVDKLGRHFTQCDNILSPVVGVKQFERNTGEHFSDLAGRHGRMRSDCR